MTQRKQAGATPRRYEQTFKQEAVRLWQSSGRSAEATARELGISTFNLYKWKHEGHGPPPGAGALPETKEALQAEVRRLRAEVAQLTEQREILKKAAGILSEPPRRGMPGLQP
jgi:transposase